MGCRCVHAGVRDFDLTAGGLGDRFGARRIYVIGIGIFVVSSVVCALAVNVAMLVAARSVQGGGAAMLGASSLALLNHTFTEPAERAQAFTIWAAGAVDCTGGRAASRRHSHQRFRLAIGISDQPASRGRRMVARAGIHQRDSDHEPTAGRRRAGVGDAALGTLAAALIRGGTAGYTNPIVLDTLAVSAATAGAFVWAERRTAAPMLPVDLLQPVDLRCANRRRHLGECRVLWADLRVQPVLPNRARRLATRCSGCVPATYGRGLVNDREPTHRGSGWRSACNRWRHHSHRGRLRRAARRLGQSTAAIAAVAQLIALGAGLGVVVPPMTQAVMSSTDPDRSGVAHAAHSMRLTKRAVCSAWRSSGRFSQAGSSWTASGWRSWHPSAWRSPHSS